MGSFALLGQSDTDLVRTDTSQLEIGDCIAGRHLVKNTAATRWEAVIPMVCPC